MSGRPDQGVKEKPVKLVCSFVDRSWPAVSISQHRAGLRGVAHGQAIRGHVPVDHRTGSNFGPGPDPDHGVHNGMGSEKTPSSNRTLPLAVA